MKDANSSLFTFSTSRPVTIFMMVLAVFTFGYISLGKLPVNLLPDIAYPTITVRTEYPGAGPEDVEERVSERIQEALAVLPGLKEISSISKPELSDLTLEFSWDTNIAYATQNIREKLDRTFLPDDVGTPIILRYDPTLDPIIRIGVCGGTDLTFLRKVSEDDIQRRLETIPGVAAVKVRGGLEEEIQVKVDKNKLRSLNLGIETLNQRLAAENVNMAAGTIKEGETEYLVRTLNQFMDLKEIMDLVIARTEEGTIKLGSLAEVEKTHKEQDIISRINGRESVEIQVFKEAGSNIVSLAEKVRSTLLGTPEQRRYRNALRSGAIEDPEALLKEARARKEREKAEGKETGPEKGAEERMGGRPTGHERSRDRSQGLRGLVTDPELLDLQTRVDEKKRMLSFIENWLPEGIELRVLSDQSKFIKNSIDEVRSSALIGGILAVLILYLFLRKAGSTIIIALSIPISVVATFAPMYLTDTSLNIMSLGGLALGIGMLVDNSIIVLESIFRCREEGDSILGAAVRGTREIGGAAVASTLTTVAVFFPIAFVEGIAGQIFRDQALTVVFSLLTSLAVAIFFIPMLASREIGKLAAGSRRGYSFSAWANFKGQTSGRRSLVRKLLLFLPFLIHCTVEGGGFLVYYAVFFLVKLLGLLLFVLMKGFHGLCFPFTFLFDLGYRGVAALYPRALGFMLGHRAVGFLIFLATGVLVYLSALRVGGLGQEILPEVHQGELIAHLSMPVGTPLEQTDPVIALAEKASLEVDEIAWVSSTVGIARDEISDAEDGEHTGRIYIKLEEGGDLQAKEERVLAKLRGIYASFPEISSFEFTRPTLFSLKSPIQVEIKGIDLEEIEAAARRVEEALKTMDGLEDVRSTVQRGNPEVRIRFNREKLIRHGLNTASLAQMISDAVKGQVPTRFMRTERKIDILVRIDRDDISCVRDLESMVINPQSDAPLPLSAVAEIRIVEGPSEIRRIWGQRAAVVDANLSRFDMGGTAGKISASLAPIREEGTLTIEMGGQGKELASAMDNMMLALYLAIFLVYIVMASQFESLYQPFIIICSIPLAFVGVVFTLDWLDIHLSVIVFIGAIMLAGIVVNNAIVLVDYINQLRRRGMDRSGAIIQACRVRLRPILMTTSTTVLGLLPLTGIMGRLPLDRIGLSLGMGEGLEIRAPMAITVISGLISSTLLTLFIIPLVYSCTDGIMAYLGRAFRREG